MHQFNFLPNLFLFRTAEGNPILAHLLLQPLQDKLEASIISEISTHDLSNSLGLKLQSLKKL